MHQINRYLAAAAFLFFILFSNHWCLAEDSQKALARVNDKEITSQDLEYETAVLKADLALIGRPLSEQRLQEMRGQIIENLIEREALYQHAKKSLEIPSSWVNTAFEDFKKFLGGANSLRSYLSKTGQTQSQLKSRLQRGLAVQRLLHRDAIRSIRVSEAEIQAFYRNHAEWFVRGEQIRARHILIAVKDPGDEALRAHALHKIRELQHQLENGADFAILALENSDCPSKTRAGDLGYLTREQMVASFADEAFKLQPHQVSDIITTPLGFELIQILDRKPSSPIAYKEARDEIEKALRHRKENEAVVRYATEIKKKTGIIRYGLAG